MAVTKETTFSESNISTVNNTSSLTITIYFSANNQDTYTYNKTLYCTCNGETQSATVTHQKGGSVTQSFTFDNIEHDSDGTKSVSWSWSCETLTSVLGTINDSGTKSLTTISRYATANQSLSSKTLNSIIMNWSSDSTIDYIWYSKDNGSTWTAVGAVEATSGSYTISNLTPSTSYSIVTRVRRKNSQLTTDSTALSVTTYQIGLISGVANFNHGDNASVVITNQSRQFFSFSYENWQYANINKNCIIRN